MCNNNAKSQNRNGTPTDTGERLKCFMTILTWHLSGVELELLLDSNAAVGVTCKNERYKSWTREASTEKHSCIPPCKIRSYCGSNNLRFLNHSVKKIIIQRKKHCIMIKKDQITTKDTWVNNSGHTIWANNESKLLTLENESENIRLMLESLSCKLTLLPYSSSFPNVYI